jgi:hypothetical protein
MSFPSREKETNVVVFQVGEAKQGAANKTRELTRSALVVRPTVLEPIRCPARCLARFWIRQQETRNSCVMTGTTQESSRNFIVFRSASDDTKDITPDAAAGELGLRLYGISQPLGLED